ncbi:MAG: DUF2071 domain-containing protein [Polyangiaceae bacterium]|nr:DUF2071 domain-containing protein [Polyangiaceae bacterium]
MPSSKPPPKSERSANAFLAQSMVANFVVHGLAIVIMALVLAPMLPGGGEPDDRLRVASIANQPLRFRLGWLPWHLCAVADLWMAVAMLRVKWIPKLPAALVLVLTLGAVFPDQYAQISWVTHGVDLAKQAHSEAGLTRYLKYESSIFVMTASYAAFLYTIAALGWTWAFAKAGTWSRALTWLSIPTWAIMLTVTSVFFLPPSFRLPPEWVAGGNALGFLLLQVWLALVTEQVLRRGRPIAPFGRDARWRHPSSNPMARILDWVTNSRLAGVFLEPLPAFAMRSDITDVVYVNYLVPVEKLLPLVPPGLELQRLGSNSQFGLFTFLTYQHHHFGFRILGPLRRFMPSPVQTNWRIHVRDPRRGTLGIYFVTNAITNTFQAVGARMLTEGMPMHVLARGEVKRDHNGHMHLTLDPGNGTGPKAEAHLQPAPSLAWEDVWKECFPSFQAFLEYCVPQDRAFSTQLAANTITRQEIHLGIPLSICEPMTGEVNSPSAAAIVGTAQPVCFRVPNVNFVFETEEKDELT